MVKLLKKSVWTADFSSLIFTELNSNNIISNCYSKVKTILIILTHFKPNVFDDEILSFDLLPTMLLVFLFFNLPLRDKRGRKNSTKSNTL